MRCWFGYHDSYCGTKADGLTWCGTTEEEAGFDVSTNVEAMNSVMSDAVKMIPIPRRRPRRPPDGLSPPHGLRPPPDHRSSPRLGGRIRLRGRWSQGHPARARHGQSHCRPHNRRPLRHRPLWPPPLPILQTLTLWPFLSSSFLPQSRNPSP